MKATVTIYRYYYKTVEIEIDKDTTNGLTPEEIAEKLIDGAIVFDEELVHEAPLESLNDFEDIETDRYDIYDQKDKQIYGGHL